MILLEAVGYLYLFWACVLGTVLAGGLVWTFGRSRLCRRGVVRILGK